MDEYFTMTEISKMLKVAGSTPYKWWREGRLPAHQFGKSVRVAKKDLEEFIRQARKSK